MNANEKTVKAFRKVAQRCQQHGSTRTDITFARKLVKLGLAYFNELSRYRRTEFGREVGPVYVTVSMTALGDQEYLALQYPPADEVLASGQPPFHCLECDGSGYHTDDCPNRRKS